MICEVEGHAWGMLLRKLNLEDEELLVSKVGRGTGVIQAVGTEFAKLGGAKKASVAGAQRPALGRGCMGRVSEKCWASHRLLGPLRDLGCYHKSN